jgi:hypothetical protein
MQGSTATSGRLPGTGVRARRSGFLARFLFEQRGDQRITVDPAANEQAIRNYAKLGSQPVGVMRQYGWSG